MRRFAFVGVLLLATVWIGGAAAGTPATDVRLTNDCVVQPGDPLADPGQPPLPCDSTGAGYLSSYAIAGSPQGAVTPDPVIKECSIAHGRQNEPAVEVDPRNSDVLIGSSNDYCGVFAYGASPIGPVWMGYYRSEDGGGSFQSSLVPGYPGDNTPFASLAKVRTASSGDPVITWDRFGRVFLGSESSGDPEGSAKTFGDEWVGRYVNPGGPESPNISQDGKLYQGTVTVAKGSSAPNLLGKFNDKTAIEADRTGGSCDGNVYFSWSRFTGGPSNGFNSFVYFTRSTNHGVSFSSPMKLSQTIHDIQSPDVSVTGNGHVYVTFRQFASAIGSQFQDAVWYVKSTDCGKTFSAPHLVAKFEPYDATDLLDDGSRNGECGDGAEHCQSGYTFFRRTTQVRGTADQSDHTNEYVYIVYDPSKPGTEVPSGSTYGTIVSGDLPTKYHQETGSQSAIYFTRLNGATGVSSTPELIDNQPTGLQLFPDISASNGFVHAMWWDTRLDSCYSPMRPVGNCADGTTVPSLDTWGATSTDAGTTWTGQTRVSDVTSNPEYEQFGGRTVPFAGDYLWVTSLGAFSYGTWTDYRDTVQGVDQRETTEDEDNTTSDVKQCRTFDPSSGSFSGDTCPHSSGLDQNIFGDQTP